MQPPHQHLRSDLTELKAQIMKKLGPEVAKHYFLYLNRFLSVKMSKVKFDELCFRILGRDNIPLHNQFIRSVLKNACIAKSPPPKKKVFLKHTTQVSGKEISADAYLEKGSHITVIQASGSQSLSNGGDMLHLSPQKSRNSFRERKTGDTHSALGIEVEVSVPMYSKNETKLIVRTDGKDAMARIPIQPPLGVPFFPVSISGARRALPSETSITCISTSADGALLDSHTLREQMEQIASAQNLEVVAEECANVLNHGLDSYLKGLIRSCIELVGVRSGKNEDKNNMKLVNGVRPGFQYQIKNSGKISLQDFRVAMELNPRQLGEDWSSLLEKICTLAFEE